MLRSPRLFVEAKGLEKDLSDRKWISQVLGYATVVGVEWCVLTNGDEYRLYNAHAPVDVEQKLFRVVRISESDQEDYTLETLELLSKVERIYKGAHLEAEIQPDRTIAFDGETYRSLSLAASFARKTIIGAPEGRKYPQTNGWTFWKYHDRETGKLEEVDVLRQRYLNGRSRS